MILNTDFNKNTVAVVETVARTIPFYEKYDIQGLFPHFLNPLEDAKKQESILGLVKTAAWENWLKYDNFSVRGNSLWSKNIVKNYQFQSMYEWQLYWYEYRKIALKCAEGLNTCFLLVIKMTSTQEQIKASFPKVNFDKFFTYEKQKFSIKYGNTFKEDTYKETLNCITKAIQIYAIFNF